MRIKLFLPVICLLCFCLLGFVAQQISFDDLIRNFEEVNSKTSQEKIYLHTDKPYYAAGDTIWFKAYLVDMKMMPSVKSRLMYVELLNPADKLQKRIRLPLVAGTGWGEFTLPDTLSEGNYRIRAFTSWMRNFDAEFFYDHTFKIGNSRASQAIVKTSYHFHAEGDNEVVNAALNFKNIAGFPYVSKEVNYNVEIGGRTVERGKATTDGQGNIEVNFKNNRAQQVQEGMIHTGLMLENNTVVKKDIPVTKTGEEVDIQFFPEGGDLISGLRNRVAFKAIGKDGLSRKVSGLIKGSDGMVLAKLSTVHKGMGSFAFAPVYGQSYEAIVQLEDGAERKFPLPQVKEEGVSLTISPRGKDSVVIHVIPNSVFVGQHPGETVFIVAQSANSLVYTLKIPLTEGAGSAVKLPLKDFPTGIAQFTLFNSQAQPLAERLFFVYHPNAFLNLDLTLNQTKYSKRSPVALSLSAKTQDDKTVKLASFSVSVIDETKVPVNESEEFTIFSELLLDADLKGYVEEPNYYFTQTDVTKLAHLDLLMLTQGWRRFSWQDIVNNNVPALSYEAEKSLALRGQVMNNKKVVPNASLIIFSSTAGAIFQVKANENGEFALDSLSFPDSTRFVIQARKEKGGKFVEIDMKDATENLIVPKKPVSALDVNVNASMLGYLKNSKTQYEELLKYGLTDRIIMLDEVKIVEEKSKKFENSTNLNGGGQADQIFTGADLETAPTLEFALQGRVAGLTFQGGVPYFTRNGGQPAQIVLDGMYVQADMLNSINPADVESVEILKTISYTAVYGSYGSGGLIVITTKRGGSGGFSNTYSPGIISYMPLGLFQARQFYVPAYNKTEDLQMADLRSTVYWNPTLVIDSTGVARAGYFNSDGTGSHRIVVEGMDFEGHIGRKVIHYSVN